MENEEMLEQANETENVETQPTEENVEGIKLTDTTDSGDVTEEETKEEVKTYTEEEAKALAEEIVEKRMARAKAKFEKEKAQELSKYKTAESILNAGLGTSNIDEVIEKSREYYEKEGIRLPEPVKPGLSPREEEILAKAEANEIIELGIDEVNSELQKLTDKGLENMSSREKIIFTNLYEKSKAEAEINELKKNGIDTSILEDKEFQKFQKKFDRTTSFIDIVNLYEKVNEKPTPKKIGPIGSDEPNKESDYFTEEQVLKLTPEDWEKPGVWEKVRKSQLKWKK